MGQVVNITSEQHIPIEDNFKVSAGPGAGKTHWLILHIKDVVNGSSRLGIGQKIACITYTNVGVDTIKSRLLNASDKVVVSTIHSFLYENVVKYYLPFIAQEEGFNIEKVRVVDDETILGYSEVKKIGNEVRQHYLDASSFNEAISKSRWRFKDKNCSQLVFKPDYPFPASRKSIKASIKNEAYANYKKDQWSHGIMTYDDILYFSFQLIKRFPMILEVLRDAYPYFFIDEFQDSTPLQVEIIKKLGKENVVVGVVGDKAQSIYGFAGADPKLFDTFETGEGLNEYVIKGNRRSTWEIIKVLNKIRDDIEQTCVSEEHGEKPIVYIGDRFKAYENAMTLVEPDAPIHFLSYRKESVNAFREKNDKQYAEAELMHHIEDSNTKRLNTILALVRATEQARQGAYDKAFRQLSRLKFEPEEAIGLLKTLLNGYTSYSDNSLVDYINYLKSLKIDLAGLNKGTAKTFYEAHSYKQLALGVEAFDEAVLFRTIHKAKGDEFDNVFIGVDADEHKNKLNADFLLHPDLIGDESQRVYYVAASRARKRLFIQFPSLKDDEIHQIEKLPVNIISI